MYKNLLVGADNSKTALRAVKTAAELAQLFGAKLHIVTAYKPESIRIPDLPPELDYTRYTHPADALLAELEQIGERAGVDTEVHAATGEPADAIVRVANRVGADLVIVGNKGMRGAKRVLGSVPNSIAHHAQCGVLIVDTTSQPV
ncbi:MAG TPA: universal stress protein [Acidimicrobiales bacterium]|nr:universal stress protein [Acidimicrobiales bacterium]